MSINNTISNKSAAFLLFGLVISLAFVQLYQSNDINGANNVKEGYDNAKLTDANVQIVGQINSLRQVENDLYSILDGLYISGSLNPATLSEYITKIGNIDKLRVELYKSLINNYEIYQTNVIDTTANADKMNDAAQIVTSTFQSSEALNDERKNAQRYVEVNTYYAKRYTYLTEVVKIIIYICIAMLILSSLANNGLIPEWLYSWALVILLVFGLYFLGKKLFLLLNVDNMNFDKYDWHFTPPATSPA
jgi:hypothetical protein